MTAATKPQDSPHSPSGPSSQPLSCILHIFIDGACKGNPGPGGWGVFLTDSLKRIHIEGYGGGYLQTTNNRMELMAAIKALSYIKYVTENTHETGWKIYTPAHHVAEIQLYCDSQYVVKGITQWIHNWKKNDWRTAGKKTVENQDLWQQLDHWVANSPWPLTWTWVKGHGGNVGNEKADALANRGLIRDFSKNAASGPRDTCNGAPNGNGNHNDGHKNFLTNKLSAGHTKPQGAPQVEFKEAPKGPHSKEDAPCYPEQWQWRPTESQDV